MKRLYFEGVPVAKTGMLIRKTVNDVFLPSSTEHNVQLNLVVDRFPKGPAEPRPDE